MSLGNTIATRSRRTSAHSDGGSPRTSTAWTGEAIAERLAYLVDGIDALLEPTAGELASSHKRGTLKKSKEAFAMVYDHLAIDPNPLRDPRVKLPHERPADMVVPIAAHVEAVAAALPSQYLLPYLTIDWTGLRLSAIEGVRVAELDEYRQALLARASIAKNRKPIWVGLHDDLFEALLGTLPPREDRDLDAPLFPGFKGSALRTAITRACRLTGTPAFFRTGSVSGAAPSSGSRGTRWPRSLSVSGTRRSSRPSTTCTRSVTTPRSTTPSSSPGERRPHGQLGRGTSLLAQAA